MFNLHYLPKKSLTFSTFAVEVRKIVINSIQNKKIHRFTVFYFNFVGPEVHWIFVHKMPSARTFYNAVKMYELKSFCLLLEFLKKQQKSNWLLVFLTPKFCVQQWKSADPTHVKKCLRRQWSQKRRVLTFLQHWPFQPFFGRRNFSLEQLLKYRALQKTKWRETPLHS